MQIRIMVSAAINTQDTIPKFSFLLLQQNDKKHAPITRNIFTASSLQSLDFTRFFRAIF